MAPRRRRRSRRRRRLLFQWGLRRAKASHAAPLTLIDPLVAIASASLVLGQPLRLVVVAGGVLRLASTAVVLWPSRGA